jgi:drug/metabolite transporter (DMT)-like permease
MSEPGKPRTAAIEFWMLVCVLIWAVNYPVAKYGLSALNPMVFNSLRFVVAALVLAVPFALGREWKRIARADLPELLRAGVLSGIVYQVTFIIGLSMTSAGNSAVLVSTSPLWTVVIHARMHKEKIQPQMLAGMAASLLGIVMIIVWSGKKIEFGGNSLLGDVMVLAAAVLWGLNTNIQKPLLVRYAPLEISFVLVAFGAVGLTLIAIPSAAAMSWGSVHWTYYTAAVLSGVFSIGISTAIWTIGIKYLGPGRTSNFNNLVPVLAFILSYLLLDEQLFPIQIAGAALTVVGVWIVRR